MTDINNPAPETAPVKKRRKSTATARKPANGTKTLAAAIAACVLAALDLYLTVRLGIKLW